MKKYILACTSLVSILGFNNASANHNIYYEDNKKPNIELHLDVLESYKPNPRTKRKKRPIATERIGEYSETVDLTEEPKKIPKKKKIIKKPAAKSATNAPKIQQKKPVSKKHAPQPAISNPVKEFDPPISNITPRIEEKKLDNIKVPEKQKTIPVEPIIKPIEPKIYQPPIITNDKKEESKPKLPKKNSNDSNKLNKQEQNITPKQFPDLPNIDEDITKIPDIPNSDNLYKNDNKLSNDIVEMPIENMDIELPEIDDNITNDFDDELKNIIENEKNLNNFIDQESLEENPLLEDMQDNANGAPIIKENKKEKSSWYDWIPFIGNKTAKNENIKDNIEKKETPDIPVINPQDIDINNENNNSLLPKPNFSLTPPITIEKKENGPNELLNKNKDGALESFTPELPDLPRNIKNPNLPPVKDNVIESTKESKKSLLDVLSLGKSKNNKIEDKKELESGEEKIENIPNNNEFNDSVFDTKSTDSDIIEGIPSLDNEDDLESSVQEILDNLPPLPDDADINPTDLIEEEKKLQNNIPEKTNNIKPIPPQKEQFKINDIEEEKLEVLTVPKKLVDTPLIDDNRLNNKQLSETKKEFNESKKSNKIELSIQNKGSIISHISFKNGTTQFINKNEFDQEINKAVEYFKDHTTLRIKIISFAKASSDKPNSARRISLDRALLVRKELIAKGIDSIRINVQAMGENSSDKNSNYVEILMLSE